MFVCICNGITDGDIRQALSEGATSVRDLHRELGVGNCCGKCTRTARDVLREHQSLSESAYQLAYEAC
ncbi:bacterioferritin-associated ferredoxin [Neptunomonas marina]|uniref:Bacterioferritin-associated ferredoxin n=1 Tax=Neptunomonas marina TaxID=1815562 RepID=A0A437QD34_9GAMM|nr:bacterioferritin-associated ferredoxin [Neptunomonas marina]RVU32436.1 (2Fe-2S)-binding protein [Neptunomonas marina]